MDYTLKKFSRDMVWEILLREEVKELPVKVSDICAGLGISLKRYRSTDGNCGFCNIVGGIPYIFVDSGSERSVRRFTAAHELGHILLGHVGDFTDLRHRDPQDPGKLESDADAFAISLLAPSCVLLGCGVKNEEEIASLCDISLEIASKRMRRVRALRRRGRLNCSYEEIELLRQFMPFIYRYRRASGK